MMMSSTAVANKARFAAPAVGKPNRARSQVCVVRATAEQPKETKAATKVAGLMAAAALILAPVDAQAVDFQPSNAAQGSPSMEAFVGNRAKFVKDATNQGGGAVDAVRSAASNVGREASSVANSVGSGSGSSGKTGGFLRGANERLAEKARANYGVLNQDTRSAQPASGNGFRGQGGTSSMGAGSINPTEAANAIGNAKDSVVNKVQNAGGAVSGVKGAATEAASKVGGAKEGLKGALNMGNPVDSAVGAAKGAAQNIKSTATDALNMK
jgi:hypothetical protein